MPKLPPCQGQRRDGSDCTTYAQPNGFCHHHQDQAQLADMPLEPDTPPEPDDTAARIAELAGRFKDPRDALASLATERPELTYLAAERVLTAAVQGVKHDCVKCGKRNIVDMPNAQAIISAIKTLNEEALGKQQDTRTVDPLREQAQQLLTQVQGMTDEQLASLDDITLAAITIEALKEGRGTG